MNKVSLVTGCAGFIGSHIVDKLLKNKHIVFGIDNLASGNINNIKHNFKNKKFFFIKDDIKNIFKYKKKLKYTKYIFHFAGNGELIPSIEKPEQYFFNNSYKTSLLMKFVRKELNITKFIYAASSSCYGKNDRKTNEKSLISIEHPYALSKYIGEKICMHWGEIYKIPVISIRIFNAYGPRSRTSNVYGAVIGVFLKQKLSKYPLTIIGNGKQKRDFLYISDLCDAFYKAAISKYKNEIFNLGFGRSRTVLTLANLISKKHIFIPWRPGEPKNTEADITKIKKYLKWTPKVSLESGIKKVLKNIKYWKNAPLWTKNRINKATLNWYKFLK